MYVYKTLSLIYIAYIHMYIHTYIARTNLTGKLLWSIFMLRTEV